MTRKEYILSDLKLPIILFLLASFTIYFIQSKLSCYYINKVFNNSLDISNVFMLTFTGFMITAFTVLQVLESKKWFNQMTETQAFNALIKEMEVSIICSIIFFLITAFLLFFEDVNIFVNNTTFKKIFAAVLFGAIVFILSISWNCIRSIIDLMKS